MPHGGRKAAGASDETSWTSASRHIQQAIDCTPKNFVEFNPGCGTSLRLALGTGTLGPIHERRVVLAVTPVTPGYAAG